MKFERKGRDEKALEVWEREKEKCKERYIMCEFYTMRIVSSILDIFINHLENLSTKYIFAYKKNATDLDFYK